MSHGNQLEGVRLVDEGLRAWFRAAYPDVDVQPASPPRLFAMEVDSSSNQKRNTFAVGELKSAGTKVAEATAPDASNATKQKHYVELIDPPPSFSFHYPCHGRPHKIPIPISSLPENSNPENGKTLKGVNEVATSLISSEDTTMLNTRVVPEMDVVVKKRVKLKKTVYKVKKSKRV
ncbi:hypothetical protein CQW23_21467 [Capsicum baccatum]|uniref:Rhodanese domain-containing protein n=1 Tax=Capsicum baccatum TaxID=33114 RepID=A0A2G2VY30_CAPBA|nr:hypothetical protein CQW23_21467 [Capsicum baccatum]